MSNPPWWLELIHTFSFYLFLGLPLALGLSLWRRWRWLAGSSTALGLGLLVYLAPYFLNPALNTAVCNAPTLKVVSYNMRNDVQGFTDFLEREQPDIIFVQENAQAYAATGIPELLSVYPYQLSQPEVWGNMIVSRYPLSSAEDLADFGYSLPQRAVVEVEGQQIALYNLHLTWPIVQPRVDLNTRFFFINALTGYDETARNSQLERLQAVLAEEPLPWLAVGDFNLSAFSPVYDRLRHTMNDAHRAAGFGLGLSWPAPKNQMRLPPLLRIDYVWHSDEFRACSSHRAPPLASDHFAIVATLATQP